MTIVKSAYLSTYHAVGELITYSYKVTNTGDVTLTGPITVADNITGTFNITSADLVPSSSVTGTSTYTIKQSDFNNGSVTNLANATGSYNGASVISPNVSVKVTASKSCCECPCCSPCCNVVEQNIKNIYNINNKGDFQIKTNICW